MKKVLTLIAVLLVAASCDSAVDIKEQSLGVWDFNPISAPEYHNADDIAAVALGRRDTLRIEIEDIGDGQLRGKVEHYDIDDQQRRISKVEGAYSNDNVRIEFHWHLITHCVIEGPASLLVDDVFFPVMECHGVSQYGFYGYTVRHAAMVRVGNMNYGVRIRDERSSHGFRPPNPLFAVADTMIFKEDNSPSCTAFTQSGTLNLAKLRPMHIVTPQEAWESRSYPMPDSIIRAIADDHDNLTLVNPSVVAERGDKDAAEWQPDFNERWFAGRVIEIKKRYWLSADNREMEQLHGMLASGTDEIDCGDAS